MKDTQTTYQYLQELIANRKVLISSFNWAVWQTHPVEAQQINSALERTDKMILAVLEGQKDVKD